MAYKSESLVESKQVEYMKEKKKIYPEYLDALKDTRRQRVNDIIDFDNYIEETKEENESLSPQSEKRDTCYILLLSFYILMEYPNLVNTTMNREEQRKIAIMSTSDSKEDFELSLGLFQDKFIKRKYVDYFWANLFYIYTQLYTDKNFNIKKLVKI